MYIKNFLKSDACPLTGDPISTDRGHADGFFDFLKQINANTYIVATYEGLESVDPIRADQDAGNLLHRIERRLWRRPPPGRKMRAVYTLEHGASGTRPHLNIALHLPGNFEKVTDIAPREWARVLGRSSAPIYLDQIHDLGALSTYIFKEQEAHWSIYA